ncbi:carbohydrate porin [Aquirufa rosea]|uniref:Carbohydrate porin n=1 Tax=Aquirufa rosea TaxID=2509241 RepID=A0A4Q1C018_9BACT|nr:carbohydrate porin [Aquirufa rosea]RXK49643.1 carbohydrate porin [Aquirufa rosea]
MRSNLFFLCFCLTGWTVKAQSDSTHRQWSLHFQQTAVYQYHAAFDALYSGDNSLQNKEESAMSLTSTLFFDAPLWKGATFTFNPELSGGKGLSQAKGLGGFTNGETFRIGNPEPVVYVARLLLEQNFDLKNQRSIKLVIGKFGLADYFDFNAYSHDPRVHFMNWSLMNQGSWDYAANTRGYTSGFYAEYKTAPLELRASFSAVPTSANGPDLDYQYDKANGINVELTKPFQINKDWNGFLRVLAYRNQAGMGNYDLANASQGVPDITSTRSPFRTKYGVGLNVELSYSDIIGLFARYGWSDGKNETWAFTEIDQSISLGFHFWGKSWHREQDFAGIAVVANGLSASHQKYQQLGGNGFMIGDGNLNYGQECIVEAFYSFQVPHSPFALSPNFQWVVNPGYNIDRGPVSVWGLRVHTEF